MVTVVRSIDTINQRQSGAKRRMTPAIVLILLCAGACGRSEKADLSNVTFEGADAPPAELPPTIKAEASMRCKDNSLVFVTFFTGDRLVAIQFDKNGPRHRLSADKADGPFLGDGYALSGTPSSITLTMPGREAQMCRR